MRNRGSVGVVGAAAAPAGGDPASMTIKGDGT